MYESGHWPVTPSFSQHFSIRVFKHSSKPINPDSTEQRIEDDAPSYPINAFNSYEVTRQVSTFELGMDFDNYLIRRDVNFGDVSGIRQGRI